MKWIVLLAVIAVFVLIVANGIKNRKRGGCSCGCSACNMKDICHNQKDKA